MTNRKPSGTDWESWVDAVIRDGRDRGAFDDLPGRGKPIEGLEKPHDELWWVRKKLKEEGLSYLPPTLALRKDREDTLAAIHKLHTEARVRATLAELNERIRAVNRRPSQGPPSTVMPVDVDEIVARWRERRRSTGPAPTSEVPPPPHCAAGEQGGARARWWRRRREPRW